MTEAAFVEPDKHPADPEWWRLADEAFRRAQADDCLAAKANLARRLREYGEREYAKGVLAERRRCMSACLYGATSSEIAERIEAGE